MKKALVTGAAGFIGSHVVKILLGEGVEVRAMVLPGEDTRNLEGLEVEQVEGDLLEPASLDSAIKGCDTLFHLAAIYAIWLPVRKKMFDVNLQGSRNMLWSARRAEVEKVVYTSSIAALGIKEGKELADEKTEFNQFKYGNDYVITKYLSQEEALTFAREGLPLTVVNPCFPFGAGDVAPTPTGKLILDIASGKLPMYFDGGVNVIDVEDVAHGHVLAAEKGKIGEKYILGNKNMSFKEFTHMVANIAGVKAPRIKAPSFPMPFIGWIMERRAEKTGKPPLTTSKEVPYVKQCLFYDTTKAQTELGLELTPVEESISRAIEWYKKEGYFKKSSKKE